MLLCFRKLRVRPCVCLHGAMRHKAMRPLNPFWFPLLSIEPKPAEVPLFCSGGNCLLDENLDSSYSVSGITKKNENESHQRDKSVQRNAPNLRGKQRPSTKLFICCSP